MAKFQASELKEPPAGGDAEDESDAERIMVNDKMFQKIFSHLR